MTVIFKEKKSLETFFDDCEEKLFNKKNMEEVFYGDIWDESFIKDLNKELFYYIGESKPNIYAIFVAENKNEDFKLKYIGQTNSKGARSRLTNHLITKNHKTGAKLENVKKVVQGGGRISISFISIEPESLRHYIEEELIKKFKKQLDWNNQGKR